MILQEYLSFRECKISNIRNIWKEILSFPYIQNYRRNILYNVIKYQFLELKSFLEVIGHRMQNIQNILLRHSNS